MDSIRHSSLKNNRTSHLDSIHETVEAGKVPYVAHTIDQPPIAKPTAAPGGANGDGNAHIATTGPSQNKETCSADDLSEADDQPERP